MRRRGGGAARSHHYHLGGILVIVPSSTARHIKESSFAARLESKVAARFINGMPDSTVRTQDRALNSLA